MKHFLRYSQNGGKDLFMFAFKRAGNRINARGYFATARASLMFLRGHRGLFIMTDNSSLKVLLLIDPQCIMGSNCCISKPYLKNTKEDLNNPGGKSRNILNDGFGAKIAPKKSFKPSFF